MPDNENEITPEEVNESLGLIEVEFQWSVKLKTEEIFCIKTKDEAEFKRLVAYYRKYFKLPDLSGSAVVSETSSDGSGRSRPCPIHNVDMAERFSEKTKKYFYSHQLDDGSYCYGTPPRQYPPRGGNNYRRY